MTILKLPISQIIIYIILYLPTIEIFKKKFKLGLYLRILKLKMVNYLPSKNEYYNIILIIIIVIGFEHY